MEILTENTIWMSYNTILALFAVALGWVAITNRPKIFRAILGLLWILFLPNTIYTLTDVIHFTKQMDLVGNSLFSILVIQYILISLVGIITFMYGLYPLEIFLLSYNRKQFEITFAIVIFNLIIAFGVILGRIHRLNSWDIVLHFTKVTSNIFSTVLSFELIALVVMFWMIQNLIYFSLRNVAKRLANRFMR